MPIDYLTELVYGARLHSDLIFDLMKLAIFQILFGIDFLHKFEYFRSDRSSEL